jgi:sulfatase modifying factor 1
MSFSYDEEATSTGAVIPCVSMQRRARNALLFVCASVAPLALCWSCGLDVTGAFVSPEAAPPDGAQPEAHLPPVGDADLDAGSTSDAADAAPSCPVGRGPNMILVERDGGDGGFCIDVTEVTNAQYNAFLLATDGGSIDAGVPKTWPIGPCAGGTKTFARVGPATADSGSPSLPVANVTWCDGFAFCEWAGKRLCGNVAPTRDASTGEWYSACSNFGATAYPYGNTYAAGVCNDSTSGTTVVGAKPLCEGGVPGGLFDMSGNVFEFIGSCSTDGVNCYAMGGDYVSGATATCAVPYDSNAATSTGPAFGLRCCADPR